jgi:hypothetical protein
MYTYTGSSERDTSKEKDKKEKKNFGSHDSKPVRQGSYDNNKVYLYECLL